MALERGLVIGKKRALNLSKASGGGYTYTYILTLHDSDDACCETDLVVTKEMFDSVCVAGFGQDAVVEYGTVLRVVDPSELETSPGVRWWQMDHVDALGVYVQQMRGVVRGARNSELATDAILPVMSDIRAKLDGMEREIEQRGLQGTDGCRGRKKSKTK